MSNYLPYGRRRTAVRLLLVGVGSLAAGALFIVGLAHSASIDRTIQAPQHAAPFTRTCWDVTQDETAVVKITEHDRALGPCSVQGLSIAGVTLYPSSPPAPAQASADAVLQCAKSQGTSTLTVYSWQFSGQSPAQAAYAADNVCSGLTGTP